MVKIAWKVINGYGPYAYLQKSVKNSGKVVSQHIAYLGTAGKGPIPGKHYDVEAVKGFSGGRVLAPVVTSATQTALKPGALSKVKWMEEQVAQGVPASKITIKPPSTKGYSSGDLEKQKQQEQLTKTVKAVAGVKADNSGKTEQVAPNTSTASTQPPSWTKLEDAKGSTEGGVYQDEKGDKYYIKCPATPAHVTNEQLARDLYRLAGFEVLDGKRVDMDGKVCLASRWDEDLTGRGTNPKNLDGTLEGFVADAWLANWDSVGVGTTKYDNILSRDGKAVRVDLGGALLYRGTGGPKGQKFGLEVTELEGLRDPALNPVAATVYGGMTQEQIKKSAERVVAIPADDIISAVKQRYPDRPQFASELATKLLIRRTSIKSQLGLKEAKGAKAAAAAPTGGKPEQVAPKSARVATPKVSDVPKDNKGKPLVSATNAKKLQAAATSGDLAKLDQVSKALHDKLSSPAKKAAVLNAAAELKGQMLGKSVMEGDGGSGLSDTLASVVSGDVKLPEQDVPKPKVVQQQAVVLAKGKKNYDADLEQVSGKKGSNDGGLFKDKKLETLHYIKWPNSATRAKVEGLTALLYGYAQVPVPTVRTIKFNGKDAVMSDWIDDAATMTVATMRKHKDVRKGFGVDAWLANWDVVGLSADNIVKGPGNKAYRIDLGGSMLFRAQGKPKPFPSDVGELDSLVNPAINPQSSQVFAAMSKAELKAAGEKVAAVTDAQIDEAVDSVDLPKKSADYPASSFGAEANDLSKMLKSRLKARRDFVVEELLRVQQQPEPTAAELQQASGLKSESVDILTNTIPQYTSHKPPSNVKWENTKAVMVQELGKTKGASSNNQTKEHYRGWKGSSISAKGAVLRWATGEMTGEGRRALRRLERFDDFRVKQGTLSKSASENSKQALAEATATKSAQNLVAGLKTTNKQNAVAHQLQNPKKDSIVLYRGWKADQLKYLQLQGLKVGAKVVLDDPPLYSWSTSPNVAQDFSGHHGAVVAKAEVPLDKLVLSDLVNSVGSYENENEVTFKGIPKLTMEVTKTY